MTIKDKYLLNQILDSDIYILGEHYDPYFGFDFDQPDEYEEPEEQ